MFLLLLSGAILPRTPDAQRDLRARGNERDVRSAVLPRARKASSRGRLTCASSSKVPTPSSGDGVCERDVAMGSPCPYANHISEAFRIDVVHKSMSFWSSSPLPSPPLSSPLVPPSRAHLASDVRPCLGSARLGLAL